MKKLVLLGDSIRLIGYGKTVAEALSDKYETWQPEDNCRFASNTLRMLYDYKDKMEGADVIHFNVGLWDVCDLFGDGAFTGLEEYCNCVVRIAKILKTYAPIVIFSTTTTPDAAMPGHDIERIRLYNNTVTERLKAEGVIINDLFSVVANDINKYICGDHLHLSDEGIKVCAESVVRAIRSADAD